MITSRFVRARLGKSRFSASITGPATPPVLPPGPPGFASADPDETVFVLAVALPNPDETTFAIH